MSIGKTINKTSEGITSQKISCERIATFWASFVSMYSHIKASSEVRGREAKRAPKNDHRLAVSATATRINDDIIIFRIYCHTVKAFDCLMPLL